MSWPCYLKMGPPVSLQDSPFPSARPDLWRPFLIDPAIPTHTDLASASIANERNQMTRIQTEMYDAKHREENFALRRVVRTKEQGGKEETKRNAMKEQTKRNSPVVS